MINSYSVPWYLEPELSRGPQCTSQVEMAQPPSPWQAFWPTVVRTSLPSCNSLGISSSQTLSAIIGNGAVDDGAAIDTFPGIEHEKEIRKPF